MSVEDLAKAEPLDQVLQQVSLCGRLSRTETQTQGHAEDAMWAHHVSTVVQHVGLPEFLCVENDVGPSVTSENRG